MRKHLAIVAVFAGLFAALVLVAGSPAVAASDNPADRAADLTSDILDKRIDAIEWFGERGKKDAVPALIQLLRFSRFGERQLREALVKITGEKEIRTWHDWMLWQQRQTDLKPFAGFDRFKSEIYQIIDPKFAFFIYEDVKRDIRLEEVVWGGVKKDAIPALTNPKHVSPSEAAYLTPDELVFGVEINGDARAYPLRIMDWHEMFNDVVGGVPVSLAYCTLCASGILFETAVEGRDKPFIFGSSGFLYRSNKLMYDDETFSLWNQFTGRPVVGKLTGSGITLKTRPVAITRWADWLKANPDTRVLSLDTGYERDYRPGEPYGTYFASDALMFPVVVAESKRKAKDYVFVLRGSGHEKAWPLALFEKSSVINDHAGAIQVTLVGNAGTRTVRAYRTEGETFSAMNDGGKLKSGGIEWTVTEAALVGPGGKRYFRLPGHIAYWFAWDSYFGEQGEVAEAN